MNIIIECPLGGRCEYIKDNKQHRCAWWTKLVGKDPQSNKEIDEWKCAMAWMPLMMVENAQVTRGVREATESSRNENVKGQKVIAGETARLTNLLESAMHSSSRKQIE